MTINEIQFDMATVSLSAWLLKDASWSLLLPYTAWPAAVVAVCLETYTTLKCPRSQHALLVHNLAMLFWLIGNAVWMTFELLFYTGDGDPGRQLPWVHEPLVTVPSDKEYYNVGVCVAQAIFLTGVALLSAYYIFCCTHTDSTSDPAPDAHDSQQTLVWGRITPEVYQYSFIGPWIMKDLFWSLDMFIPAAACSVVVIALVVDVLRRFPSLENAVELAWITGNTVWLCDEELFDDQYQWTRVTAGVIFLSALIMLLGIKIHQQRASTEDERKALA